MLATLGFVVPEFVRIPGEQFSFDAIPRVIDAHDALPDSMIQIFCWISFVEACTFPALANMNGYDRQPGDYGFDPLHLKPTDPEKYAKMQLAELKVSHPIKGERLCARLVIYETCWTCVRACVRARVLTLYFFLVPTTCEQNGRLAMIAIGGMLAGATVTGHGFPYLP